MNKIRLISATGIVVLCLGGIAQAQDKDRFPPQNAKKLSEIIAKIEQRPDFRYISEVEWSDGGYEVTYYTSDQAKVEMKLDAVTAEPKALQ